MIKSIRNHLMVLGMAVAVSAAAVQDAAARDYKMALSWSFDSIATGFLAAQDRGYYRENGITVNLDRGYGATDTLRRLITGDIDFAVFDATLLVRAAAADPVNKVVMVSNILQQSSHTALYIKGRNIKTLADLAKSKFADTGGSISQMFPTFMTYAMKTVGQPANAYSPLQMDGSLRVPALLRGDVDVIAAFTFEIPLISLRAKEAGLELGNFNFADYGMNPYTYGIAVTRKFADAEPAMVKAAVAGSLKGWQWACNNPKEAAEFLIKYHPGVPPQTVPEELNLLLKDVGGKDVEAGGLGVSNPARWAQTRELSINGFKLDETKVPPASTMFDASFAPTPPIMARCQ